jgi:hypothetical protein
VTKYCEHVNELSGFIDCGESLDRLRNCDILKKNSATYSWLIGWLVS